MMRAVLAFLQKPGKVEDLCFSVVTIAFALFLVCLILAGAWGVVSSAFDGSGAAGNCEAEAFEMER